MFKNKTVFTYFIQHLSIPHRFAGWINTPRKKGAGFILILIFAVALSLRFYKLSEFPVGFHIDEASLGYNGYSLLLTGKDDNNKAHPLYIDMFGDNRPSGYHYLTIIPIKLFGLSEFSTRLPAALFGSITIFAIYFLAMAIFGNKKIALLSSFFVAIAPWHVVLSRASTEAIVALFFIVYGLSLVLYSFQNQKILFLLPGTLLASFSFFFYHTPRVFVSLIFLSLFLFLLRVWLRDKNSHYKISLICSFLFLSTLAFILIFFITGGTGRFDQVNIFGFPETRLVMAEQIREDGVFGTGTLITRLFHNKLINYSLTFISNYSEYFSSNFLFVKGGLPIWYQVPGMGLIYIVELPFIILGIALLLLHKNRLYKIPLIWLLIAPLTAAVTVDDIPNINRSVVMFPMIELFAAYGILSFLKKVPSWLKISTIVLLVAFLVYNFSYFIHQYFVHAPIHKNWYRNEGFGQMVRTVKQSYDIVDKVIVAKNGGMYPLILFYMQYNPKLYQAQGSSKDYEYTGFGKFFFVPQACPSKDKDNRFPKAHKIIYVDKGECEDKFQHQKIIYRKDGTRVFNIVYE